ncbi:MAG TPA: hypothetical protein H9903_08265 [Candidatus Aquabacterium excrementipullorum]|nr:hypothetical protein [Candidatus Aquabacterium excrementipullorum]
MSKFSLRKPALASLVTLALSAGAQAGVIVSGVWSPATCGPKPEVPQLNLANADSYNASVANVNTYRQAIRPYVDCVVKEANADIQAITQAATTTQQGAKTANDKIQADVKAAEEKFK